MTAVNFADRSSAAMAIIALHKIAEMSGEIFPEVSQTIMSNSYMDDIPENMPSKEEAEGLMSDITKVLEKGGFRIKEWLINQDISRGSNSTKMKINILCNY